MKSKISSSTPKSKKTLSIGVVIVSFLMLLLNVFVLVFGWLLGIALFNAIYFLMMFIAMILGYIIPLYTRANREPDPPKKPTKQIANIFMALADVLSSVLIKNKDIPIVTDFKNKIINLLEWALRDALTSDELVQDILLDAKEYVNKKLAEME